ncbi:MAG: hypothetical protein M3N93_04325 [Acidobacteriota bacterium]|nr:hypothetical protein [Acidobacteriota bacterium]
MLKIGTVRWRGKCPRHPQFDPYMDGRVAIKSGCEKCTALVDIHSHHVQMLALMRTFVPPSRPKRRAEKMPNPQIDLFGEN